MDCGQVDRRKARIHSLAIPIWRHRLQGFFCVSGRPMVAGGVYWWRLSGASPAPCARGRSRVAFGGVADIVKSPWLLVISRFNESIDRQLWHVRVRGEL